MPIMYFKIILKYAALCAITWSCSTSNVKTQRIENVALSKPTVQDGDLLYPTNQDAWVSRNTVDGKKSCLANVDYRTYSGTAAKEQPWWQVDLGDIFYVENISVYGRPAAIPPQLKGFQVYLSLHNDTSSENHVYNNTEDYGRGVFTSIIRRGMKYVARYVTLVLPISTLSGRGVNGSLLLCEVEVYGTPVSKVFNIAPMATISRSSVLSHGGNNYSAVNIKDQNTDSAPEVCDCCWSSANEQNPWIQTVLPYPAPLITINIIGRTDTYKTDRKRNLDGLQVRLDSIAVHKSRIMYNATTNSVIVYPQTQNVETIKLSRPEPGNGGDWFLVICEIFINRHDCQSANYGYKCSETCHHCKNGAICDFRNGNCPDGCSPGYNGSRCDKACQDGLFGDCTHVCHCNGDLPCSKTNGYCHNGCAFGWGRNNCSKDLDLIRRISHIHTNQSSTFLTYDSSKAVDRKDRTDIDLCNCCSVTSGAAPSWWQLDLGNKYLIDEIMIFGRGDLGANGYQLEHANIYAGNKTIIDNNTTRIFIYRIPTITNTTVFTKYLERATIAQFFIVEHSNAILTICEFKLYERVCKIGKFGTGCSHQCHCSDKQDCDPVTGKCQIPRCLPGWRSESCDLECEARRFGQDCNEQCHCINQTNCSNVNGACELDECDPGWIGQSCDTACNIGRFGTGCSHRCHCLDERSCDSVTGECPTPRCLPGWRGESCNLVCSYRSFGYNCSSSCHCRDNTSCDPINGKCSTGFCDLGWKGSSCDKDINIIQPLKSHIKTSMSSVANTWSADRAIDGNIGPEPDTCRCCSGTENSELSWWMIEFGEKVLLNGITVYSRNNEEAYKSLDGFELHLSDNIMLNTSALNTRNGTMFSKIYEFSVPNILSKYIKIQRPGVLTLCEVQAFQGVCPVGTFGRECAYSCHCADNKLCDTHTGDCQSSICKIGWFGPACDKRCPQDTFGDECSEKCYCLEGTCTSNYGGCPGKCRSGFRGPHCNKVVTLNQTDVQTTSQSSKTAVIGGTVGASIAVLIVAVVVGVLVYRSRKRNSGSKAGDYITPNMYDAPKETPEYDNVHGRL